MLKKNLSISEILKLSFQFLSADLKNKIKEGFSIIMLITIAFNGLNFLITTSVATNFTIILFVLFSMFLTSCVGVSIHKEILIGSKVSFLSNLFSEKNVKYLVNILLITFVATSPLLLHLIFKIFGKINILGVNLSYLFLCWILTCILALKFIFILPKIALGKKFSYSISEANNIGIKLFVIFIAITIIFFIPSIFVLSFQLSILKNNSGFYLLIKPIFDFISFYISYLNYVVIFAAISFAYKKEINK